jgi:hypothetical protein
LAITPFKVWHDFRDRPWPAHATAMTYVGLSGFGIEISSSEGLE